MIVNWWIDSLLMNWYKICSTIYPIPIQSLSLVSLIICWFISIDGSIAIFYPLSMSIALLLVTLNFLLNMIYYLLSTLTALSAVLFNFLLTTVSGIRLFCLHHTILYDPLVTLKIYWIINLALNYLNLFTCMELARFFTILFESAFKTWDFKTETI